MSRQSNALLRQSQRESVLLPIVFDTVSRAQPLHFTRRSTNSHSNNPLLWLSLITKILLLIGLV